MSNWIRIDPLKIASDESPYGETLPSNPGCYVVYCDEKPVYVGQTTNLYKRIYSYDFRYGYSDCIFTPWGNCKTLYVKYRAAKRFGDWAMYELRVIKKLQPIFNCVGSVKKRGSNA